ncbi:ImmA/IrrE family metallo-endopeptidase [Kribbella sp. NPDC051586]|uniref:ImmA/IrrE family metallo-endopeptidase n=1 Tax=Kribbella sp. NPDC051586 TaxID=3364118 RepID=UPI0037ACC988
MNRVRVTVDDLRSAAESDIRRSWSDGAWIRWLDAAADLRGQSFRNVVLIKLQMPEAFWVDGRQGWQRRGRRVRRGASGIRIVAAATEVEHSADPVQGHGVTTLWDVSQTDGRPLEASANVRPQDAFAAFEEMAVAGGYRVERGRVPEQERGGATVHRARRIVVADDLDVPTATMSLAHELAHLRMHKHSRDLRCHGVIRVEADAVAYLLLARLGCLPDRPSADLIARTSAVVGKNAPTRMIETLGGRVVSTGNRLYDAADRHLSANIRHAGLVVASSELAVDSGEPDTAAELELGP